MIDVKNGKISLNVGKDKVVYDMNTLKYPFDINMVYSLEAVDEFQEDEFQLEELEDIEDIICKEMECISITQGHVEEEGWRKAQTRPSSESEQENDPEEDPQNINSRNYSLIALASIRNL